ncbi:hypothetical protein [Streptomyces sp. NPDC002619]|uniref:hypothetical protein n=1 Tax=Streptomyces sp. NPDC002619 TaxID=3364655 RepID=UPI003693DD3D
MPETRLTPTSYLVLGIIGQLGEASPYDVKVEAGRTVAPFWQVPHAQYDRLLAAGLFSEIRQRQALEFGIRYERMMVGFWEWGEDTS